MTATDATVTIDLNQHAQALRDHLVMFADLLGQMSDTLAVASAELYTAAAPDTDVTDEDAIARRTINNPAIREAADNLAAQGVNVGVVRIEADNA